LETAVCGVASLANTGRIGCAKLLASGDFEPHPAPNHN
jgi:hypothetical protein